MQPADIETRLKAIQKQIVAGNFGAAVKDLGGFLAAAPDNTEALYMVAVCQRYLGEFSKALATLEDLKQRVPEHGRAHQEEGHTLRRMGRPRGALNAYSRATRFNPALVASWKAQQELLDEMGRPQAARAAAEELAYVQALPKALLAVMDLVAQGRLLKAEDLCKAFMQKNPVHVEGMRLLADIAVRLGVMEDAETLLQSAVALEPKNHRARMDYVQVLRKRQKLGEALDNARELLEQQPENPRFESLFAVESMQSGDFEVALEFFERVLEKMPHDPVTLTSRGHALKTAGDYEAAVASYREATERHPQHGEAYHALSNLKVYRFSDEEIDLMRAQEGSGNLSHMDRVYLYFALGKAFEDRGEFDESFRYYEQANALRKSQSRYDAQQVHEDLDAQRRVCDREFFLARDGWGHPANDPIFVVGLPRAGSTLIEQILSSHSQVDGTLELPNLLSLSQRLRRRKLNGIRHGYPDILPQLPASEFSAFGESFLEETQVHRRGAARFTDKMPNNFRHIGLIRLMLPNARVIDARRHPLSCCFSAYKQFFAEGQEFSNSLEDLGHYYRDYVTLMDHWDEVLPGFVLRVQHEDVVADLEGQVRRLLDFCGLPFEENCVNYHRTERNVRTPSSEQVRQPIFTSSLEQWRHYESHLGPLVEALGTDLLSRFEVERGGTFASGAQSA
jgi:tetratricopeptide (TPR) repeat protein